LVKANKALMVVQYYFFMVIFFGLFCFVSLLLTPVAYIFAIFDKVKTINQQATPQDKLKNNILFLPFGLIILCFDFLSDMFYFGVYMMRPEEELKQIIIPKDLSTISHKSIRELDILQNKYAINKIKTVSNTTQIKNFSKKLNVVQNIQFLLFSQFIPKNGWGNTEDKGKSYTLKTMKTQELEQNRKEELRLLDDTIQLSKSKYELA
jgi:hypothetical protein